MSQASPRSDFIAALAWMAFGFAVAIGAWRMDRLEKQDINPYTVPGLLPGLLGVAIVFFGALMLWRSWRQGALGPDGTRGEIVVSAAARKRFGIVLALCLAFAVGLLGHGLPFWAAASLYVGITIASLQYAERRASNETMRGLVVATVIGLGAGIIITLVFQEFFLVRLP